MPKAGQVGPCSLCGRVRELTFHHLIPRSCHGNKWFRKRFSREEMRGNGIDCCRLCHDFLHQTWSEKELGRSYHSREAILADPAYQRFRVWVRKLKK